MSALDSKLRSQLDSVCQKAREKAEEAARSALQKRAVDAAEPHPHFTAAERKLRNRLRARGRQAGDVRQANKTQGIEQLTQELAYEYWHRMLFARFLAENQSAHAPGRRGRQPGGMRGTGQVGRARPTASSLAARYASKMLPQVFRTDDVLLEIEFAPEHRLALEKLLAGLPKETFLADDSLGWVYQFWQTKRKEEVNKSGEKIDGRTLPAVTQLFTEDYMVQFLLHNTIGAWWCARHGNQRACRRGGHSRGQGPGRDALFAMAGRWHAGRGHLRRLAEDAQGVQDARPLLRQRAFPGGGVQPLGAAADARRGADGTGSLRCGAAGKPLWPRTRSPLYADCGVCPGGCGVEVPRRRRPAAWLPRIAAAEHCLHGDWPAGDRGRMAEVGRAIGQADVGAVARADLERSAESARSVFRRPDARIAH